MQPQTPEPEHHRPPLAAPRNVQLGEGESLLMSVRPCPSGTWYAYLLTLGLWEFWRRKKAYTLTNQRIIETKGILEKTETSLPLFFIQDATLRTWFFPRWGAVSLSTAGEVGAFTGTLWLRQAEARSLREGIVQEAERTRAVQGGLRPGGSSPLGAPRSAR